MAPPRPPMTQQRRDAVAALFVSFDGVDQAGGLNKHRVASSLLEPLTKLKKIENTYSKRMLKALELKSPIAGIAAVAALQGELFAAFHPGQKPPNPWDTEKVSLAMSMAGWATEGAISKFIDQHYGSFIRQAALRQDIDEVLAGELEALDLAIAAEPAEAAADDDTPTPAFR